MFASIGRLIKKIFKAIFKFIAKLIKALGPLLLILAVIWFAPAIAGWLTSVGAPSFLTTSFSYLATTVTPLLQTAVSWLGSTVGRGATALWSSFSDAKLGTQLSILGGAAALIAPDEFGEVIQDAADLASDVIGTVAGAVGSSIFNSPVGVAAIAAGLYFLVGRERNNNDQAA